MLTLISVLLLAGPPEQTDRPELVDPPEQTKIDPPEHTEAELASKRGRLADAARLWTSAYERSPRARYAIRLAETRCSQAQWDPCWRWLRVAAEHPCDDAETRRLTELTGKFESEWSPRAARLDLTVFPGGRTDVEVTIDGIPWLPPRSLWRTTQASRIVVRVAGSVAYDDTWTHGRGTRIHRTISVRRAVMRSPDLATRRLREGEAQVVWAPPPEGPSPLRIAGWSTFGAGLAIGAIGAGLWAHGFVLRDDMHALNADLSAGQLSQKDFDSRFDALEREQNQSYLAAVGLVSIGGAALVTSLVLLLLPEEAAEEAAGWPRLEPTVGGGRLRFGF